MDEPSSGTSPISLKKKSVTVNPFYLFSLLEKMNYCVPEAEQQELCIKE